MAELAAHRAQTAHPPGLRHHFDDMTQQFEAGNLGMWVMNGSIIASGALVGSPGAYTVATVRDYNGDLKADILLQDSKGSLGMWIMNGSSITGGALVGSPGSNNVAY